MPHATSAVWPAGAIALLLCAQFTMLFTRAINWDEFFYYNEVHAFAQEGHLGRALQSFHVRLFAWLPGRHKLAVDSIVVARVMMFACELVTLGAIFALVRRFAGLSVSVMAVLTYLSAGLVFQHGFAFRTDPMATMALMSSLALLAWMPLSGARGFAMAVCGGLLVALAAMTTIKLVLYATCFAGLSWMRWREDPKRSLSMLCAYALAAVVNLVALYSFHASGVGGTGDAASNMGHAGRASGNIVMDAAARMFFLGMPNNLGMILKGLLLAPVLSILILCAPVAIARSTDHAAHVKVALVGLWLPVLTLAFYENTASYYFVFMLAPVCVSSILPLAALMKRLPALPVAVGLLAFAAPIFATENRTVIDNQRKVELAVRSAFPTPVAYFDHPGAIPGFDKRNGFMTPWGMKGYQESGVPTYVKAMKQEAVPLLLANWWLFGTLDNPEESEFLAEDTQALRENYIHISGPLFIAGRELKHGAPPRSSRFLVPGSYTVLDGTVIIDGTSYEAGTIIEIDRGEYIIEAGGETDARLVWGISPVLPARHALDGPLWVRM